MTYSNTLMDEVEGVLARLLPHVEADEHALISARVRAHFDDPHAKLDTQEVILLRLTRGSIVSLISTLQQQKDSLSKALADLEAKRIYIEDLISSALARR